MTILRLLLFPIGLLVLQPCLGATEGNPKEEFESLKACASMARDGLPDMAETRDRRFEGKVPVATALCRGGEKALQLRLTPWVDWSQYWGTGDLRSRPTGLITSSGPSFRGLTGALFDLEYERIELLRFNLFDNNKTYKEYVTGRTAVAGPTIKVWPEMRLPSGHPDYQSVGGDGIQVCKGDLIRSRTPTGICNDILNPLMGSSGQLFARNVEFDTTFPDLGRNELTKNRHGNRLSLLMPDPQVVSRKLFTRSQSHPEACNEGLGLPNNPPSANCEYKKAAFLNVLAAFWIQFMTHDWFSHLVEGHNHAEFMPVGCQARLYNNVETPLTADEIQRLGCRPGDRIDKAYVEEAAEPEHFVSGGKDYLARAPKTMRNNNTAWWDASQLYGYDDVSRNRVKLDRNDPAKLRLDPLPGSAGPGYLPLFEPGDPINPEWTGQEATGFPDNWTIGLSFFHNVFAREHNAFVDEYRKVAAQTPLADCGLRNPSDPSRIIRYKDVSPAELFDVARLVVSAEIAKIHTTEWTPQLLYNEPLYKGMNANWNGLLGPGDEQVSRALSLLVSALGESKDAQGALKWYSVLASGPGIVGLGSRVPHYDITDPAYTNGGVNHFGSPFNFPEEFVTVYRLHPLLPDLIEYRRLEKDPNTIVAKIPLAATFRGKATDVMHSIGLANSALSMGRQRLGLLTLHNHPLFLQNLRMSRLESDTHQIDVAALDLIRDRERGVPRFNEFRRQYGLRQLTSYDDFMDRRLPPDSPERPGQEEMVKSLRELYGQHVCDSSKVITDAQRNEDRSPINDCLGSPNGTLIDNIEDVDTVVGWLAESTRPHGFAISETQFIVFVLNASRRLFSDRFFTSSFRPEFYTTLGLDWVNHNGPGPEVIEKGTPNGHKQPVSPLKRVLMRTIPELKRELQPVVNVFDPWARDRGEYYSLEWIPRPGAQSDEAFPR
ncbi:MAG TPA: peroxidase family protein [Vicinamibacteria bacterium]|nr:peroxidase family protein [Vicinamibacteria bacterium]